MDFYQSKMQKSIGAITQITADQLDDIIIEKRFKVIDVRTPDGIHQQGGIPGAINIPLEEVKIELDHKNSIPESVFNKEGPFLFCCTGGVMSYIAALHAQQNGVSKVYNLEGGHSAWKKLKKFG